MKILFLSYQDIYGGGAFKACSNLSKLLIKHNYIVDILVFHKNSNAKNIYKIDNRLIRLRVRINQLLSKIIFLIFGVNKDVSSLNFIDTGLGKLLNNSKYDVINIHWSFSELISIREISNIKKKVIFSLHDLWLCNGFEHIYSNKTHNKIGVIFKEIYDRYKMKKLSNIKLTVPSQWLKDHIHSYGYQNDITVLPNYIDASIHNLNNNSSNIFTQFDKKKILFGFGANLANKDPNKGFDLIDKIFKIFFKKNNPSNFIFITFGFLNNKKYLDGKLNHKNYNFIEDQSHLNNLLSSLNFLILPSYIETFSLLAGESILSGTPVVCFDSSGLRDTVNHKRTGYKAKRYDLNDFSNGMSWVLEANINKDNIRNNYLSNFSEFNIINKFEESLR